MLLLSFAALHILGHSLLEEIRQWEYISKLVNRWHIKNATTRNPQMTTSSLWGNQCEVQAFKEKTLFPSASEAEESSSMTYSTFLIKHHSKLCIGFFYRHNERGEWAASLLVYLTQELKMWAEVRRFLYSYAFSRALRNLCSIAWIPTFFSLIRTNDKKNSWNRN